MTGAGRPLLLAAGAILAVVTGLALASYPARDDWTWAVLGRDQGFLGGLSSHWQHWSGRWAYTLAMLAGGHLGAAFVPTYPLWPLLIVSTLGLAAGRLVQAAGLAPSWGLVLLAGLLLLPGPAEGLFWQSGAVGYVLPLGLGALLLLAPPPTRAGHRLGLLLGGLVLGGWTETPTVLLAAWCVALIHRPASRWILGGLVLGVLLVISAPGNNARLDLVGGWRDLDGAALGAATVVAHLLLDLLTTPWVVAALALASRLREGPAAWPWGLAPVLLGALAAAGASCISVGFCEPRQLAALWLHLLMGLLVAAWCLGRRLPAWGLMALLLVALLRSVSVWMESLHFLSLGIGIAGTCWYVATVVRTRQEPDWSRLLLVGLVSAPALALLVQDAGRAPAWRLGQAHRDRAVERLVSEGTRQVTVPPMPAQERPRSLSVGDLITGGDWQGRAWADWMGLERVVIDPRATDVRSGPASPPR